ncbi:hypothetical protein VTO73DRAFT_10092 [Trametes versicolor]
MAQDLKRKRGAQAAPKAKRLHADEDAISDHSSAEESMGKIKDASELFRSTSFKSQIDAMLPNVRPKYDKSQSLDTILLSIHKLLMELPAIAPQHPLHASRTLSKQCSWITKTAVKAKDSAPFTADLAIEMPSTSFQEKDYLNGRVFQKRAYYLGVVASAIAKAKSTLRCELFYESISGDPRRTCLVLRPIPDDSHKSSSKVPIHVRIIPFIGDSPIPLQRLSPARSNIRAAALDDESKEELTPLYNTAYMLMTTPKAHTLHIHALAKNVPSFADALTLLRVWANQRGYGLGSRMCVRGFEGKGIWWASILDLIVNGEEPPPAGLGKRGARRKPLGKGLSSYQLFKAALDFLARHNFGEEAAFVKSKDGHRFPPSSYSSHEAVFVDATSSVNLLADVPLAFLDTLRYDAQSTLELLDHASISEDTFAPLFLQEHRDVFARFDVVARMDLSSVEVRTVSAQHVADHGSAYNAAVAQLVSTLRRGLGDRAKSIAVLHASSDVRPTSQALPTQSSIVHVGIILDSEHAFRLVDHGPPAEEEESERTKQFREFWGDKAELRRFKDGSIAESVVWDVKNADERARIPAMITHHLLARHFGLGADAVQTWQTEFDTLLKLPESISSLYQASSASVGFKSALSAFDALVKHFRALDEQFPLAVLNVSPVSPALRYTDVFVPATLAISSRSALPKSASYLPAMEIITEFEKSARWPDDLRAIQKMKLAFFERLASILMHAVKGLQATVVLGECPERTEIEEEAALDIITADGWAFRARIWHDREATLLDRIINDQPHVPKAMRQAKTGEDARERQLALHARELYTRRFIHAPRHHRAIAALYHRFPAFANTVRLTKRRFAAHWLLRGHVSEEAVELLCAHVLLRMGPPFVADAAANAKTFAPGSKQRGFARVIEFLKDWEWTAGLDISLDNADQTAGDSSTAPPTTTSKDVVWSLRTPFDPRGHMWTSSGPNAVVARRITTIAKATWECLNGLETGASSVNAIFHHPTDHYDFVIELNPALSTRYHQKLDADPSVWTPKGKYANAIVKGAAASIMPSFDPFVMFYGDQSHVYVDTVLLFHDPLGGDRIGAVWQPNLRSARPFRALGGFSSIPSQKDAVKGKEKDKGLVVLNEGALFAEVQSLGSTLVAKIVPWDT